MALDTDIFSDDLAEVIADLPVTCVFRGRTFTATSSDDGSTRALEIEGVLYDVDRSIVFEKDDLPTLPKSDEPLTVGGKAYRVLQINEHPDGHGVECSLKAVLR
jgi:hypothetical protein